MEFMYAHDDRERDEELAAHRVALTRIYNSLPTADSAAFWRVVEAVDMPLEVIVRAIRSAHLYAEGQRRDRLIELLFARIQVSNELWANTVLNRLSIHNDERYALVCDLCADLYESVLRAILDSTRTFWEENVMHCLRFERKHVYHSLIVREGLWSNPQVKRGIRIPRRLLASLDQPLEQGREGNAEPQHFDIEDERAHEMFLSIERSDLLQLVLLLPTKLSTVVLLLFWEERSEKETAQVLGITDRTVRNRVRSALKRLRDALDRERELSYE